MTTYTENIDAVPSSTTSSELPSDFGIAFGTLVIISLSLIAGGFLASSSATWVSGFAILAMTAILNVAHKMMHAEK